MLSNAAAQIGVCNGMLGSNLPNQYEVVALYRQYNIERMRLYGPNRVAQTALSGTNIELMLGVPSKRIHAIASSQAAADASIHSSVESYYNVNFKNIAVGNEIAPGDPNTAYIVLAM